MNKGLGVVETVGNGAIDGVGSRDGQDIFPLLEVFRGPGGGASQLVLCVLRTASLLDRVVERALGPFGLYHAQFNALLLLQRRGEQGLRPSVIGAQLCVSRPNVTKLLSRLKVRGLIEERPDPVDGRAVLAMITEEGIRIAGQAHEALSRELNEAVGMLPDEDGAALRMLLDRFRDGLSVTLGSSDSGAEFATH